MKPENVLLAIVKWSKQFPYIKMNTVYVSDSLFNVLKSAVIQQRPKTPEYVSSQKQSFVGEETIRFDNLTLIKRDCLQNFNVFYKTHENVNENIIDKFTAHEQLAWYKILEQYK